MSIGPAAMPHLLRPWWLLALAPLPLLLRIWIRDSRIDTAWKRFVDPHLLASLLQPSARSRGSAPWLFAFAYALAVLALAGPAWRHAIPVFVPRAPLVIVQDMSSHMLVADLAPSRLVRARLKIQQLIQQRKGGQLGLVAYAGDAFTVAPVSEDAHSLSDLVVALVPDTMPVDGQRADLGLRRAADLLAQAGFSKGTILLLSDSSDAGAVTAAREIHARGFDIDVLGIGTTQGAPLPTADGTFAQDGGVMRIARRDETALRSVARAGGGGYADLAASGDDLAALDLLDPKPVSGDAAAQANATGWRDDGPFLLLALLPLAALGFRRGWLAIVLLAFIAMPMRPAQASPLAAGLWQRPDQRADAALRSGDAATASAYASSPAQSAAAAYRKGDFAAAASLYAGMHDADADYNRGNALAHLQRYPDAIAAYASALRKKPGMADARANLQLVRRLQQRKQEAQQHKQKDASQANRTQRGQNQQQQQGQSDNQENMQHDASTAQQQGGQERPQPGESKASPKQQASPSLQDDAQSAPDKDKQAHADAAEKQALQQAMRGGPKQEPGARRDALPAMETTAQREQREATEALLQRVPDDPGALLRRKFALEYARRQREGGL